MLKEIDFRPLTGLRSPHLQMVCAQIGNYSKREPISETLIIPLEDEDKLYCILSHPEIKTPLSVRPKPTIVLIHGLGGSHSSGYLVRMAQKFNQNGYKVARVDLRGSGLGKQSAIRPYNGGTSQDVFEVLKTLKRLDPSSQIILIGFSLGGNIALKLAGELGSSGSQYIQGLIGVCPVIDLYNSVQRISKRSNWIYHRYYLWHVLRQSEKWLNNKKVNSLFDYDNQITAPLWGYKDALDYYEKCSSKQMMERISIPCQLLFAADDPFVDYKTVLHAKPSASISAWLTQYGAHMGFLSWSGKEHGIHWIDKCLLNWVSEMQATNK